MILVIRFSYFKNEFLNQIQIQHFRDYSRSKCGVPVLLFHWLFNGYLPNYIKTIEQHVIWCRYGRLVIQRFQKCIT